MATFYGDNETIAQTANSFIRRGQFGGNKKVIYDTRTLVSTDSSNANGSVFDFGDLPAGSTLVGFTIYHEAMAASTTLAGAVGATTVVTAAGSTAIGSLSINYAGVGLEVDTASTVTVTLAGAAATSGKSIKVVVEYVES